MLEVAVAGKTLRAAAGTRRTVLRDVAFSLKEGEVAAVLGPSGCGKTTLLRIIAGLDREFEGDIKLRSPRRVGMVFQEPRLLPWRTVRQNLLLAGAAPGSMLDDIVAALGLCAHLDHYPGELSLGLARRAAIARAFAIAPTVLLLDEPFVSLDEALALRLRAELILLVEARRTTTLIVTHDVDEAIALADRIIILSPHPGRMVAEVLIAAPRLAMTAEAAARSRIEIEDAIAAAAA